MNVLAVMALRILVLCHMPYHPVPYCLVLHPACLLVDLECATNQKPYTMMTFFHLRPFHLFIVLVPLLIYL